MYFLLSPILITRRGRDKYASSGVDFSRLHHIAFFFKYEETDTMCFHIDIAASLNSCIH